MAPLRFAIVGSGRAGSSLRIGLEQAGWANTQTFDSSSSPRSAGDDANIVILAVPDRVISSVAEVIVPSNATIIHVSGATTLEPLAGHPHHGSVHPLASLTGGQRGADALIGSGFAVASSTPEAAASCEAIVAAFEGSAFVVNDEARSQYHATASVAANHLAALCAQVERLSDEIGIPATAFWPLMRGVLHNVEAGGAHAALTGPVARADWPTVARHFDSIDSSEHELYRVLAKSCAQVAGHPWPAGLEPTDDRPSDR